MLALNELTVEAAYDVIAYACSLGRLKVHAHAQFGVLWQFARQGGCTHVADELIDDGALSLAVFSAENVYVGA